MNDKNKYVRTSSKDPAEMRAKVELTRNLCLENTANEELREKIRNIEDERELRAMLLELKLIKKSMA